jgi:hypothetical protein
MTLWRPPPRSLSLLILRHFPLQLQWFNSFTTGENPQAEIAWWWHQNQTKPWGVHLPGDKPAILKVKNSLLAYAELLRRHIQKEDNVLYPMADRVLTGQDQQALAEAFEKVEAQEIGQGVHEKYHRLAHELAEG